MATGGPETALATGQPDIEGAIAEAAAASVGPQAAPATPEALNPLAPPGAEESGSAYSLRPTLKEPTMPGFRLRNEDFYGKPDPTSVQTRTGPVPVPSFGQVPLAIAGMQLAEIQKQRKETQDAIKNFDLYTGIGKAPAPYAMAHSKLARAGMDRVLSDAIALHGGDKNEAIKYLLSDAEGSRRWKSEAKNWEIVGQQAQHWFDSSTNYLKGVESGDIEFEPELYKSNKDLQNAVGEFGGPDGPDVMDLVQKGKRTEQLVSREKWFNDMILPHVEKQMQSLETAGKARRGPNGYVLIDYTTQKQFDGLIDAEAKRMAALHDIPVDEAKDYLKKRLPTSVSLDVKTFAPQSSSGGSGSEGKTIVGDVEYGPDTNFMSSVSNNNLIPGDGSVGGVDVRNSYRVPLSKVVSGRPELITEKKFHTAGGSRVDMIPTHLAMDPETGEEYIEGPNVAIQEIESNIKEIDSLIGDQEVIIRDKRKEGEEGGASEDDKNVAISKRAMLFAQQKTIQKRADDLRIPLKGNESTADLFFGAQEVAGGRAKLKAARDRDRAGKSNSTPERRTDKKGQTWEKVPEGWKAL